MAALAGAAIHVTSLEFAKRTNGATEFSGQRDLVEVIGLGGGVPITVGNERIGGLGLRERRRRKLTRNARVLALLLSPASSNRTPNSQSPTPKGC
jgi:hypothetical protein